MDTMANDILRENLTRLGLTFPEKVTLTLKVWEEDEETGERTAHFDARGEHEFLRILEDFKYRHALHDSNRWAWNLYFDEPGFKGQFDSDGKVSLVSDLRTALTWRIVTDGGSRYRIDLDGLDEMIQIYHDGVRSFYDRYGHDPYYGREAAPFLDLVRLYYRYEKESQYGDGYCSAVQVIWSAACFDLYGEHRAYPYRFAY